MDNSHLQTNVTPIINIILSIVKNSFVIDNFIATKLNTSNIKLYSAYLGKFNV